MKIALMVEGETEIVFLPQLRSFLEKRLARMPAIKGHKYNGRIPKGDTLSRDVKTLLSMGFDHVIALTDVYTGTKDFTDAEDAKTKMRQWVGPEPRFHPHAAQYDFEAWLLPYWKTIQKLAGHNRNAPPGKPETVNHDKAPSYHIKELYRIGTSGRSYIKTREAKKILERNDLNTAIESCPQLKSFINTILEIEQAALIP